MSARLSFVLAARLAVMTAFLVLLAFFLPADSLAFYGLMALAYTVTIPYALWLRNQERYREQVPLQFVVDLVVVTGLVYFTGGPQSDLVLLYPLVILAAGIASGPRRAVEMTALCMLVYLTLVLLLNQGVMVPYGDQPVHAWSGSAGSVGMRLVLFGLFGGVSAYLSKRCSYVDRNLARLRELAEVVFRHLPAGLLVVDESDRILLVNDRVLALAGFEAGFLQGRPLDTVVEDAAPDEGEEMEDGCTPRRLVTADGRRIPVQIDAASLDWKPALLNPQATMGPRRLRVLAITDIRKLVELQRGIRESVRAKTIGVMASEIAHEIRNPIAAISGSVQILDKLEKRSMEGDSASDRLLAEEKGLLYDCIVMESDRLGRVIEKFVDYSEFSVDKLRQLMEMPEISGDHKAPESSSQVTSQS